MARTFAQIHKVADTLAAQPVDTTISAATQNPQLYVYGPPGARRARTYSQVIAEATNGGIDSSANLHNGGKPGPNGPKVEDRQAPDWRGHYLGKGIFDPFAKFAPVEGSLYVHRPLTNAADLHAWAAGVGIPNLVPPEEMHVTQVYSREPVSLNVMGGEIEAEGGPRSIAPLGDKGAVVLHFVSQDLQDRHADAMAAGASHDWPKFLTHVTLSYDAGDTDLAAINPPSFPLVFGPEIHAPINEGWAEDKGFRTIAKVSSISDELGVVFGWAIVCTEKGKPYYDLNIDWEGPYAGERVPEHIPEPTMLKACLEFMDTADRPGNEMHAGPELGKFVCAFPLTADIAKAMGITSEKTGLMVGYMPPPAVLAKFKSGEYTGFSIEGWRTDCEEHD
jgi:hypothetical protein